MAPGSLSGALWDYFLAWAQKWLQEASLELSDAIFNFGLEIAPEGLSGLIWGYFLAWADDSDDDIDTNEYVGNVIIIANIII